MYTAHKILTPLTIELLDHAQAKNWSLPSSPVTFLFTRPNQESQFSVSVPSVVYTNMASYPVSTSLNENVEGSIVNHSTAIHLLYLQLTVITIIIIT